MDLAVGADNRPIYGGVGSLDRQEISGGNPDLVGHNIEFFRLVVMSSSFSNTTTADCGQFVTFDFAGVWQIWGFSEFCGNQIVDGREQCDDGNSADDDGCSSTCQRVAPLPRDQFHCQNTIGSAGKRFFNQVFATRQQCLTRQLKGVLPTNADCRATPTQDSRTDNTLNRAQVGLYRNVQNACNGLILEGLGFPSACFDPNGPPFVLRELQQCIYEAVTTQIDTLLDVHFPRP